MMVYYAQEKPLVIHPMWFSDAFVDGLDLAAAGFGGVVPKVTARPAFYRHRKVVFPRGLPNL
jgi:hypothetical protein